MTGFLVFSAGCLTSAFIGYMIGHRTGEYNRLSREGNKPSRFHLGKNKGLRVIPGGKGKK